MGQKYTTVMIEVGEGDNRHIQQYVTLVGVTEEQIRSGNDIGLICLCLAQGYADTLADLLNDTRKELAA